MHGFKTEIDLLMRLYDLANMEYEKLDLNEPLRLQGHSLFYIIVLSLGMLHTIQLKEFKPKFRDLFFVDLCVLYELRT